ncbi:hypothetical protein GCM10010305_32220 [Streptomyces termitum]|uniref:Uncharacterized protein n=1 Tax=Streptomyces termitum TaxID=67368 RepID=A0A918T1X5_9ACTN|nr:hypothetical protein GCM10010305_32220 [Streptomyces termitum]
MRTSPARVSERGHRAIRTPLALNSGSDMPIRPFRPQSSPQCAKPSARAPAAVAHPFPKAFLWTVKGNVCPGESGIVGGGKPGGPARAAQRGDNP